MTPDWLLISGDFVPTGGMDGALLGLARYLAQKQPIELVAHRIADELQTNPMVTFHPVRRPAGKHLLGAPLLAWQGRTRLKQLQAHGTRIVCNGGNCPGSDINWVHYVHAAYKPHTKLRSWTSAKLTVMNRIYRWAERSVLRQSRYLVCNSRRSAQDVIEQVGVPTDRVHVVYYGYDPERFPLITSSERTEARAELDPTRANRPWAVFVGALGDARKGFDTLYHAWKELVQTQQWEALLWVVGSGAERTLWESRAAADGLGEQIRFLGFRTDVPKILAACDVLIHPARYEAYGLGVQEALGRGLPAIVSAQAGVAERYPQQLQDLLLQDPESVAELVDRLRHWHSRLEQWPERIRPLAEKIRARTWDVMAEEFVTAVGGAPR